MVLSANAESGRGGRFASSTIQVKRLDGRSNGTDEVQELENRVEQMSADGQIDRFSRIATQLNMLDGCCIGTDGNLDREMAR
jgi:hypothetical protein